jgi:CubicO group peptidase (beta-lactamase class C family)
VFSLRKSLAAAHERTGVPAAAAALHRDGSTEVAGSAATAFRIASITKSFTATAVAEAGLLDNRLRALLSHTAGYRPESREPLPEACAGLWSYSNAGYWEAGEALGDYAAAVQELVLGPLGLAATGFTRPADAASGHQPEGVPAESDYPAHRRPGGGLWSTVGDLVTYGLAHCERWPEVHEPVVDALGESYALGWWARRGGILDHEGSVAGYQSLLLLVPAERLVLAVLTNSWKGSALIRHVVEDLGVVPRLSTALRQSRVVVDGTYRLDTFEAEVRHGKIVERETDPVTGGVLERKYPVSADAALMSWRCDFPRDGVARIGWTAMPQVE